MTIAERIAAATSGKAAFYAYLTVLAIAAVWFFAVTPLPGGSDTDMYFHLAHGRHIVQEKEIPNEPYFSFLLADASSIGTFGGTFGGTLGSTFGTTSAHAGVDYSWLFQVFLYAVYAVAGETGLILFRGIVYFLTALFLYKYIFSDEAGLHRDSRIYLLFIFILVCAVILVRDVYVRPHIMTYLLTIVFIYILEHRKRFAYLIPVLAVLWVNMHGIEYPVIIIIAVSRLIEELLWQRYGNTKSLSQDMEHAHRYDKLVVFSLTLALAAIYLTPHGQRIITLPFQHSSFIGEFIKELRAVTIDEILSLSLSLNALHHLTVYKLTIIVSIVAAIVAVSQKRARIGGIIMFVAATYLLTKGFLLVPEFALLALPIVKRAATGTTPEASHGQSTGRALRLAATLILLPMPFVFLSDFSKLLKEFPISPKYLPHGVVRFLEQEGPGGSIMAPPNMGGYLIWRLYPKYKIFMDLEVNSYFHEPEFFIATNTMSNPVVLTNVINVFKPGVFIVPLNKPEFGMIIRAHPSYVPVFFDDIAIVYANGELYPDLAGRYQLKAIDPFTFQESVAAVLRDAPEAVLVELNRLHSMNTSLRLVNEALAMLAFNTQRYKDAISYAETITSTYPDLPTGYRLKAESLLRAGQYKEALPFYNMAVKRSGDDARLLYMNMALAYVELGNIDKAYETARKAVPVFNPATTYRELYNLALIAAKKGHTTEALMLLKLAIMKTSPNDPYWFSLIQKELSLYETINDETVK